MKILFEKLKLKQIMAWLLIVCTVMSTFVTSISVDVNANSNDIRRVGLSFAKGDTISTIGSENIDENTLQVISLYLSNFYTPFMTILNGDFSYEDSNDAGNDEYIDAMTDALISEIGMNRQAAEFIVQYSLEESLNTCCPLYVRVDDLKTVWLTLDNAGGNALFKENTSVGFTGVGCKSDDELYTKYDAEEWGVNNDGVTWANDSGLGNYDSSPEGFDAYCKAMGTVTGKFGNNDIEFVPVTYPIFLSIFNYTYKIASVDTVEEDKALTMFTTYDISNRVDSNPNEDLGGLDYNSAEPNTSRVPVLFFYYLDSGRNASVVFSNSEECMQAYAMVNSGIDYEKGWGSAFSMYQANEVKAIASNNDSTVNACVAGSKLYVNWEGSIIMDTGTYRTPIFPGCANPHMLTKLDGYVNANSIPLQNIWGIDTAANGAVKEVIGCDGVTKVKALGVKSEGDTLFNLRYWRACPASSDFKFDINSGVLPGYGDWDVLFDALKATKYFYEVDFYEEDVFIFPSWDNIANSSTYRGASNLGSYTLFGAREFFGHPILSTDLVYFDDIGGATNNTPLNEIFRSQDLTDTSFLEGVGANDIDPYANFSNITTLGHTTSYSVAQQKCFRSLFFTYCFAYFNKDKTGDFNVSTDIVDLRTNFDNFPTYNKSIDWDTLYSETLEDQVLSFAYYILHPTEGINYVATLLKNKVGGFLLRCHDDMVGSSDSNSSTGMTKYLSTSSYTTTSGLNDVTWIAKLLDMYDSLIVYMIILMCLVLVCYIITGSMTLSRGIIGVLIFALLSFIPPFAINSTVGIINTTSETIYSKKFDYWALTQLETWLRSYESAIKSQESGDFGTYAAFVLNNQAQTSSGIAGSVETTFSGTKVKWMTPKKYNSLATVANQINSIDTDAEYLKSFILSAVHSSTSGETYIESDSALYLYRDYTDIYRWGAMTYNTIDTFNFNKTLNKKKLATGSKYFNVVPVKNSSVNTVVNSWISSNYKVNKLSSDLYYKSYIIENGNYSKDLTAVSQASSINYMNLGFLYKTIRSVASGSNYYYDVKKGGNFTLASTFLTLYNENVLRVHQKYKALKLICDGTKKLNLDDNALDDLSDLLNKDISTKDYFNFGGNQHTLSNYGDLKLGIDQLKKSIDTNFNSASKPKNDIILFRQLSSMYYSLYAESPYYFFNYNVRDQLREFGYDYSYPSLVTANSSELNNLAKLLVANNQEYFYNYADKSGDGYGELRDFMNMHDLFYYIIPMLKEGVDLANLYDDTFGLYIDNDCSLSFNVTDSTGLSNIFTYNGQEYSDLSNMKNHWKTMSEEERYKFWHSYNTYTILLNYTAWLGTMMDCDYADSENIYIMGDKFKVEEPLNPYSYFETDNDGNIVKGRLMVFSRSEMAYYGLTEADLTTVERKILELQDNVYAATLDLMNYYTLSDETLIQAYSMVQTFEFNKIFSQDSLIGESFTLYPQGYELKGFSYDAYLRMIIAEASGEPLMTGGNDADGETEANSSIYRRVLNNTSLFFALFLLINDILAVYLIPGLKLFFIVCIFITSVLIIIGSAIKMELNMFKVMWQSLFAPLLSFAGISMGMSLLVSMFMGDGTNGVVQSSATIDLGDPTATIIVMIIINAGVTILYFKVCKKCFHDLKTYGKAIFDNIGSTVVGAVGTVVGAVSNGSARDRLLGTQRGNTRVANTPKQRGKDNMPSSGKTGAGVSALGAAGLGTGLGAGVASDLLSDKEKERIKQDSQNRANMSGMNKYDKKAYQGATDKQRNLADSAERSNQLAQNARGLNKKRLEVSASLKKARSERAGKYADDVKNLGKTRAGIAQFKRDAKAVGGFSKSAFNKAKAGGGRIKSGIISGVNTAKKVATDSQTHANIGAAVANVGNARRAIVPNIKKGVKSGTETMAIRGMYAADAVKNAPRNAARAAKSGAETVAIHGMVAMDKGRAGLNRARASAKSVGTGISKAYKTASTAYSFTSNKKKPK